MNNKVGFHKATKVYIVLYHDAPRSVLHDITVICRGVVMAVGFGDGGREAP